MHTLKVAAAEQSVTFQAFRAHSTINSPFSLFKVLIIHVCQLCTVFSHFLLKKDVNNVSLSYNCSQFLFWLLLCSLHCQWFLLLSFNNSLSPFLELQLKDHHRPFKLRKVWAELLKKFTVVTDEVAEKGKLPLKCPSCICLIRITLCFVVIKNHFFVVFEWWLM